MSANSARPALGGHLRLRRVVWAAAAAARRDAAAVAANLLLAAPSSRATALPELHWTCRPAGPARRRCSRFPTCSAGQPRSRPRETRHPRRVPRLALHGDLPVPRAGTQRRRGGASPRGPARSRRRQHRPGRRRRDKRAGSHAPLARPGGLALADGSTPAARHGLARLRAGARDTRAWRPGQGGAVPRRRQRVTSERATSPRSSRPSWRSDIERLEGEQTDLGRLARRVSKPFRIVSEGRATPPTTSTSHSRACSSPGTKLVTW